MRRALLACSLAVAALLALGGLAPIAAQDATPEGTPEPAPVVTPPPSVGLTLRDADGAIVGSATLVESAEDGTVTVTITAEGLTPGDHGVHIHGTGICDPAGAEPFGSAGGHFNPTGAMHGGPPPSADAAAGASPMATPAAAGHAGDLGNLTADDQGNVRFTITTDRFTLSAGAASLQDEDGSALIIHADPDDLTTDPDGNSGAPIACGVIFAAVAPAASPAATPAA